MIEVKTGSIPCGTRVQVYDCLSLMSTRKVIHSKLVEEFYDRFTFNLTKEARKVYVRSTFKAMRDVRSTQIVHVWNWI